MGTDVHQLGSITALCIRCKGCTVLYDRMNIPSLLVARTVSPNENKRHEKLKPQLYQGLLLLCGVGPQREGSQRWWPCILRYYSHESSTITAVQIIHTVTGCKSVDLRSVPSPPDPGTSGGFPHTSGTTARHTHDAPKSLEAWKFYIL